jgi:hypothetical protein
VQLAPASAQTTTVAVQVPAALETPSDAVTWALKVP